MRRKWFLWRALGTLVVVGLLAGLLTAGGMAVYRTGWSQGYMTGQAAVEGEEGEIVPAVPPYAPYWSYPGRHLGFHPFFFGAGLVKIGLFFLLLIVIGKAFRWMTWGRMMAYGPWRMGAHHRGKSNWSGGHRHQYHGPIPPWCWDWDSPKEQTEETSPDPDAQTNAAKE